MKTSLNRTRKKGSKHATREAGVSRREFITQASLILGGMAGLGALDALAREVAADVGRARQVGGGGKVRPLTCTLGFNCPTDQDGWCETFTPNLDECNTLINKFGCTKRDFTCGEGLVGGGFSCPHYFNCMPSTPSGGLQSRLPAERPEA
jgi:hypothetical protein